MTNVDKILGNILGNKNAKGKTITDDSGYDWKATKDYGKQVDFKLISDPDKKAQAFGIKKGMTIRTDKEGLGHNARLKR